MKIAVMKFTITTIAVVLGAARAVAGPAPTGWGGTNVCTTNLVHTSLTSQLSQYDADGDGTISSNEFASAGENMVQALQSRFLGKYDTDHDGSVTSDEALAVNQAIAEQWLTNLLAHFDLNGDGAITTNEFPRFGRGHEHSSLANDDLNREQDCTGTARNGYSEHGSERQFADGGAVLPERQVQGDRMI